MESWVTLSLSMWGRDSGTIAMPSGYPAQVSRTVPHRTLVPRAAPWMHEDPGNPNEHADGSSFDKLPNAGVDVAGGRGGLQLRAGSVLISRRAEQDDVCRHYVREVRGYAGGDLLCGFMYFDQDRDLWICRESGGSGDQRAAGGGRRAAWLNQTFLPDVSNSDQATALQVAIWDVVHDAGNGLGTGSLRAGATPGPVVTLAEQYILASEGQEGSTGSVFTHVNGPLN
jgi:hypothetical protein